MSYCRCQYIVRSQRQACGCSNAASDEYSRLSYLSAVGILNCIHQPIWSACTDLIEWFFKYVFTLFFSIQWHFVKNVTFYGKPTENTCQLGDSLLVYPCNMPVLRGLKILHFCNTFAVLNVFFRAQTAAARIYHRQYFFFLCDKEDVVSVSFKCVKLQGHKKKSSKNATTTKKKSQNNLRTFHRKKHGGCC